MSTNKNHFRMPGIPSPPTQENQGARPENTLASSPKELTELLPKHIRGACMRMFSWLLLAAKGEVQFQQGDCCTSHPVPAIVVGSSIPKINGMFKCAQFYYILYNRVPTDCRSSQVL